MKKTFVLAIRKNSFLIILLLTHFVEGFIGTISVKAQPQLTISFKGQYVLNDCHLNLTNYIEKGTGIKQFLDIMGNKVGRVAIFGNPFQQQGSYSDTGTLTSLYYTQTNKQLYYYSFTDAYIAMAYKSLSKKQQDRFDPMITGFNPADLFAKAHIKRVLKTFPGVFTGIGEFAIQNEFISNTELDSIFDFAAEVGLIILVHNDVDISDTDQVTKLRELFLRHQNTTIIWAHCGVGRVVLPLKDYLALLLSMLQNPNLNHVHFDISSDQTSKCILTNSESIKATADLINKYPDRFIFGTDALAPTTQSKYLEVYDRYAPLFAELSKDAKQKLLKGNYERIFNEARIKVREWEKEHAE